MIKGYPFPYQQSADPIQPDPGLMKWKPEDNQPPRKTVLALALLAGFVFVAEPSDLTPAETVTLDKWYQPLSEPARPVPALHAALQQAITNDPEGLTQPEDVKVTSWLNPLAEPQPAPRLVPEGVFGYVRDVETPDVTWLRRLDEPVLPTPPVAYQQETTADPEAFTQPEAPQLDKWYRQFATLALVEPHAVTFPQPVFVEDFAADLSPSMDTWYRGLEIPTLPAPPVPWQISVLYQGEPGDFVEPPAPTPEPEADRRSDGGRPWWDGEWIIPGETHYLPEKPPEDVKPLRPKVEEAKRRLKKARPPKVDRDYQVLAGKIGALSRSTTALEQQAARVVDTRATAKAIQDVVEQYRILADRQQEIDEGLRVLEAQMVYRQRIEEDDQRVIELILDVLDKDDTARNRFLRNT